LGASWACSVRLGGRLEASWGRLGAFWAPPGPGKPPGAPGDPRGTPRDLRGTQGTPGGPGRGPPPRVPIIRPVCFFKSRQITWQGWLASLNRGAPMGAFGHRNRPTKLSTSEWPRTRRKRVFVLCILGIVGDFSLVFLILIIQVFPWGFIPGDPTGAQGTSWFFPGDPRGAQAPPPEGGPAAPTGDAYNLACLLFQVSPNRMARLARKSQPRGPHGFFWSPESSHEAIHLAGHQAENCLCSLYFGDRG